jgi:hypothetical protein
MWPRQMERWALATLVVSVQSQREAARIARRRERRLGATLVSGLTVFALAVDGYHPYAEDGGLYVAGVKRLLDPALYPHGTEFVLEPMRLSLFAPSVAGLVRLSHLSLPVVLLGLHLASMWAMLYGAWMLAGRCWSRLEARAGAIVLLACWLSLPVAGTALVLMDPYVTARSFSTPCMVLALVGALDFTEQLPGEEARRRRGLMLWAGSLALAGVMHPLMAAYALGGSLLLVCLRAPRRAVRVGATAAICVTAVAFAGFLQLVAKPESAEYIRIALTRTYWFPAEWRWFELVGLAAPVTILGMQGWIGRARTHISETRCGAPESVARKSTSQKRDVGHSGVVARMAVVIGLTACVVAVLFARAGADTHLVARLQPLRAFQVVYVVMVLILGAKLGQRVLRRSAWRWGAAMMVLGGVMLGAQRSEFPHSNHLEFPGIRMRNPWVQAFLWIRTNTPKDALFALDADYINAPDVDAQSFRAIAERSALADYSKDGGEAAIAPDLTGAWLMGQKAQQGLSGSGMTDSKRTVALRPLGVSWVVLEADAATNFACVYENGAVKVCRLR